VGDIVRESTDGATLYELLAGWAGWEATSWLTPWGKTPVRMATLTKWLLSPVPGAAISSVSCGGRV
jgi:hypothetical protein